MTKARSIMKEKITLSERVFIELVVWEVPAPLRGSLHHYKYRLALISDGKCALRYDNESGKGDHKHIGAVEVSYTFQDLQTLKDDFLEDVREWLK